MENIDLKGTKQHKRKTITVDNIKEMANEIFANEKITQQEKRGLTILVEAVLTGTLNYKGFGYIEKPFSKENEYTRVYI